MRTRQSTAAEKDDAKVSFSGKRKMTEAQKKAAKRVKVAKDADKPKKPPTAFFLFMEEFRKTFKPNPRNKCKYSSAVSKAGGYKWNSMSDAEKAPYVADAEKRNSIYGEKAAAYYKKKYNLPGSSGGAPAEDEVSDVGSDQSHTGVVHEELGEESEGEVICD